MSKSSIFCGSLIFVLNLTGCASMTMSLDEIVEDYEQRQRECEGKQPLYTVQEFGQNEKTGKPNLVEIPTGPHSACFSNQGKRSVL